MPHTKAGESYILHQVKLLNNPKKQPQIKCKLNIDDESVKDIVQDQNWHIRRNWAEVLQVRSFTCYSSEAINPEKFLSCKIVFLVECYILFGNGKIFGIKRHNIALF